ncbi:hypothetical protein TASCI_90032 [Tenacibaculum ascidiaceicola]
MKKNRLEEHTPMIFVAKNQDLLFVNAKMTMILIEFNKD